MVGRSGLTSSDISRSIAVAKEILLEPSAEIFPHLQHLARAYTLMAFLQETPQVQGATRKLFGQGQIWLDASIILPAFAETLLDEPARAFTHMLSAAREAGNEVNVTRGVLEEVAAHIRGCRAFFQMHHRRWRGRVPFLAAVFEINRPSHAQLL